MPREGKGRIGQIKRQTRNKKREKTGKLEKLEAKI